MAALGEPPWLHPVRAQITALRRRGVQALLLHGPAGIGKLDLAFSVAAEALCEKPAATGRPCGQCPGCQLFAVGNHPDLRVVLPEAMAARRPGADRATEDGEDEGGDGGAEPTEPAPRESGKGKPSREIRIEAVRALAGFASLATHRGGARVVVVAPADALNAPAANALLKVLEEPPAGTLFLLVTDQPDLCLPTVRSRCVLVRAPLPATAQALAWLQSQQVEDAPRRLLEAGGAPLAVLRSAEEGLAPELRQKLLELLRRGPALHPAEVAAAIPRTLALGPAVALCQRWGWDYLAYRTTGSIRYHPGEARGFEQLGRCWSVERASDWLQRLAGLQAVSEHPLNARTAMEGALLDYIDSIGSD